MKNRSKSSFLSPLVVVSMAHPPVKARLQAILSPQQRQRPSRSSLMLASLGTATCAVALSSVQVKAGQAPPPSSPPSGAAKPAAAVRKSPESNEAATLRKKLDALEQILVQNQKENLRLRQQVHALEMQQHRNAALAKKATTASKVSADQIAAAEALLRDLQQQQALLRTRAAQAEALYRSGTTNYQDASSAKSAADVNLVRIDAVEAQLQSLKAGHQPTMKEQILSQLREHLAENRADLVQEQEELKVAKARAQAGLANNREVTDAEMKINVTQTEIDKIKVQLLQETAR